ncbi:NAD(P)-binding protein [Cylindrobasidium torrendii FP15055 ss-10]|uniref:NAD(P)-binding protein n=1 Tax=Cylindrobasidium torrendii FP15055 ss-10 TaxID=1314674 RepID=A0A0D7BDW2_9AGAR|nr:NAD(P)-binding protein [Cylindrobasidium torrendii FP15055 ss-10]
MSSKKLSVLITGCKPGGLGNALAREFHSRGLRVFATARNASALADLESLGIETLSLDVTSRDQITAVASDIAARTGGTLDILINNAGRGCIAPLLDVSDASIEGVFNANVFSVVKMVQGFSPLLIAAKGKIVNVGSISSLLPLPFHSMYCASKAALHQITDVLRTELAPFGVEVTEIISGGIKTKFMETVADPLPEGSLYKAIEGSFASKREEIEHWVDAETFAIELADQVLKSVPPKWYWMGTSSWKAWFATSFLPQSFKFSAFKGLHGLDKLTQLEAEKRNATS